MSMVGNKNILKKTSVKPFLIAIGIGVLTFIVYLPVVYHGFIIYDDPDYITLNPYVLGTHGGWYKMGFYSTTW